MADNTLNTKPSNKNVSSSRKSGRRKNMKKNKPLTLWEKVIKSMRRDYPFPADVENGKRGSFLRLYPQHSVQDNSIQALIEVLQDGGKAYRTLGHFEMALKGADIHLTLTKGAFTTSYILNGINPWKAAYAVSNFLNQKRFKHLETTEWNQSYGVDEYLASPEHKAFMEKNGCVESIDPADAKKAGMQSKMYLGRVKKALQVEMDKYGPDKGTPLNLFTENELEVKKDSIAIRISGRTLTVSTRFDADAEKGKKNLVVLDLEGTGREDTHAEAAIRTDDHFQSNVLGFVLSFLDLADHSPFWRLAKLQPFTQHFPSCKKAELINGKLVLHSNVDCYYARVIVSHLPVSGKTRIQIRNGNLGKVHTEWTKKISVEELRTAVISTVHNAQSKDRFSNSERFIENYDEKRCDCLMSSHTDPTPASRASSL